MIDNALAERFDRMVDRSGEHHLWTGATKNGRGTGRLKVHGRNTTAQRGLGAGATAASRRGTVELGRNTLGRLIFRLWGDDGTFYYGAHLSSFAPAGGHVAAGTVLGFVGTSGNAAGTPTHLHFEIHPGDARGRHGGAVNPTPDVEAACTR